MKSMTGYGRASFEDDNISLDIEIRSVNSRFLDLKIFSPRELNYLEIALSKKIKNVITRGKVNVNISFADKRAPEMELNEPKLLAYWDIYQKAIELVGTKQTIELSKILSESDIIRVNKVDIAQSGFEKVIEDTLDKAIVDHQDMAAIEGKSMQDFFILSLDKMEQEIDKIEVEVPAFKKEIFNKIKANVEEILEETISQQDHKRLMQETAYIVEKSDVTEELVRLRDHFNKFRTIMMSDKVSGKSLAFIIQEMHREINTTGSKFSIPKVFSHILIVKEEVEKCKEMIANVC